MKKHIVQIRRTVNRRVITRRFTLDEGEIDALIQGFSEKFYDGAKPRHLGEVFSATYFFSSSAMEHEIEVSSDPKPQSAAEVLEFEEKALSQ